MTDLDNMNLNPNGFPRNNVIFLTDSHDKRPVCKTSSSERESIQVQVMNGNGACRKPPVDLHCLCMVL